MSLKKQFEDLLSALYNEIKKLLSDYDKEVNLTKEEIERKERLIQTFIVIFGLFVSNDHNFSQQHNLNFLFYEFFFCSLSYYTLLSKKNMFQTRFVLNFLAVIIALSLGSVTRNFISPHYSDRLNETILYYSHSSLPSWFVNGQLSMLYLYGDPVSFETTKHILYIAFVIAYSLWV